MITQQITPRHLQRLACLYVRQSTLQQVFENTESTARQYEKHDAGRGSADWPAYLRMADKIDPDYRN